MPIREDKHTTYPAILKRTILLFLPFAIIAGIIAFSIYNKELKFSSVSRESAETSIVNLQREAVLNEFDHIVNNLLLLSREFELHMTRSGASDPMELFGREFLIFSDNMRVYDQVRLLDETGMELIRVNLNGGKPYLVPKDELQFKGGRYYFNKGFQLGRSEIYVSPFDLNMEEGKIEQPLKPMIRLATPVFYKDGRKRGIVIVNYLGGNILNSLKELAGKSSSRFMLINSDGFWLVGPTPDDEWGFMFEDRSERRFDNAYPEAWQEISETGSGLFYNEEGMFAYNTVYPSIEAIRASPGKKNVSEAAKTVIDSEVNYWKIVSYIPEDLLNAARYSLLWRFLLVYGLFAGLWAMVSWQLARISLHRKIAQERLEKSEASLTQAQHISHLGNWEWDLKSHETNWSDELFNIFHLDPKKCHPGFKVFLQTVHPEDREFVKKSFAEAFKEKKPISIDHRIVLPDSSERVVVHDQGEVIFDENGEPLKIVGTIQDVTEQKRTEEALRRAKNEWDQSFNALSDHICILDMSGAILRANRTMRERFEPIHGNLIGLDYRLIYCGTATPDPQPPCAAVLKGSGPVSVETELPTMEGWYRVSSYPSRDEGGKQWGAVSVVRDITERKRSEEQLNKLFKAVEQSTSTVVITDIEGSIEYVNPIFTKLTGYSVEEAIGQNPRILKSGKTSPEEYKKLWDTITSGGTWQGEFCNKKKNGELYWESASISPVKNSRGVITNFLAVKENITERKLMEQDLLLFRGLMDQTKDGIFINDAETGRILDVNESACSNMGYTREELIGKRVIDFDTTIPDDFSWEEHVKELHEKGSMLLESGHRRKDGTEFPVEVSLREVEFSGKRYNLAVVRDITERKQTEDALYFIAKQGWRESGEFFFQSLATYLAETCGMDYVLIGRLKDEETVETMAFYSRGAIGGNIEYKLAGTPCEQVVGKDLCCYPEDIQKLFPEDEELVRMEAESYAGIPLRDSKGDPVGLITLIGSKPIENPKTVESLLQIVAIRAAHEMERIKDEEKLRKSHERFVAVMDSIDAVVYVADMETYEVLFANRYTSDLLGDVNGKVCWQALQSGQTGPCSFCTNDKLVDAEGNPAEVCVWEFQNTMTKRWFGIRDRAIRWVDGRIVRLEIATDITERKQAEEELSRLNRALKVITECGIIMVRAADEPTFLRDICQKIANVGGYSLAWVGFAELDEKKTVRPLAWSENGGEYVNSLNISWADDEFGRGPTGTAIRTGKTSINRNAQIDPDYAPWRKEAIKAGHISSIALPLIIGDVVFGALNIYSVEAEVFNKEEVELLERLAGELAYGIRSLRERADLKKADEALCKVHEELEKRVEQRTHDLGERVKELNCLYGIAKLYEANEELDAIFLGIVNTIPPSLQYPEITCARIVFKEREFKTDNFEKSKCKWILSSDIKVVEKKVGEIEVCYLKKKPEAYEGPFLKEERALLDEIASRLGAVVEHRQADEALREGEKKYRQLVENLDEGIWVIDKDSHTTFVNPRMAEILGYSEDELLGKHLFSFMDEEGVEIAKINLKRREEGIAEQHDFEFLKKDGTRIYTSIETSPILDETGNYIGAMAAVADITARKEAENALRESEHNLVIGQGIARMGNWKLYPETGEVECSDELLRIFGIARDDMTLNAFADVVHPEDREYDLEHIQKGIEQGVSWAIEHRLLLKDGTIKWVHAVGEPMLDKNGKTDHIIGITQDITERKEAEEQIKASLHEKEILLREVHHRVKNNMQVISSLLRMQAEKIKDEGYADMLRESQERIRSMSLLHEKLYQSQDFANVDFKGYVETLVNSLFRSHGVNVNKVKVNMVIEDIKLDLENAIPCGLIINELISNSLKYAFPESGEGEISLGLSSTAGDEFELVVADNGVGIPEDVDIKGAETLGLYLVTMLGERQLDGEVEFSREGGTKCLIRFKRQEYKPRI